MGATPRVHVARARVTTPRSSLEAVTKQVRRHVERTGLTKETSMTIAAVAERALDHIVARDVGTVF